MRNRAALFAFFVFAVILAFHSASFAQRDRGHFDGYGFVSSYYDNNVFSYSSQDRDLYNSGLATGNKFPIESLGDVVTTLALRGDYRWEVKKRSMWRVRLSYDGTLYGNNTDKNYNRFGATLERIKRNYQIGLSANYTPEYYLRNLYWRPMPDRPLGIRYAAATYKRLIVAANGNTRLSDKVDGNAMLGYAKRDYNYPFDERDNNTYMIGAGVNVEMTERFEASFNLTMDLSRAAGADSTNPAVDDVSNNRFGIDIGGTWRFASRWLFVPSVDYGHQVYTTGKATDISHYNRTDNEITLTGEVRMMPRNGWQPEAYIQYRASSSSIPAGLAEYGQYKAYRLGMQVTYYF